MQIASKLHPHYFFHVKMRDKLRFWLYKTHNIDWDIRTFNDHIKVYVPVEGDPIIDYWRMDFPQPTSDIIQNIPDLNEYYEWITYRLKADKYDLLDPSIQQIFNGLIQMIKPDITSDIEKRKLLVSFL